MKLLKVLFLFICVTGFSQTKVGTIDVDFILSQMPELPTVQTQVDEYGKSLEADLQKKLTDYQNAIKELDDVTLTFDRKKKKQDSILAMEQDIQKFQQNGQQLITLKRDELLRPLYSKIGVSLEKVAKAGEYTQVLDRNSDIVYIDNNYDLTLVVCKDLGIEVKQGE